MIVGELSETIDGADAKPKVSPEEFVGLARKMGSGAITRAQAKEALRDALRSGKSVGQVVEARGLEAISDQGAIEAVIERVVARRPGSLDEARSDKKSFSYLVGQVLKEEPRAQPAVVAKLLAQRLRGAGKKS